MAHQSIAYFALLAWFVLWVLLLRQLTRAYVRLLLQLAQLDRIAKNVATFAAYVLFSVLVLLPLVGALIYRRNDPLIEDALLWHAASTVGFFACLVPVYRHIFVERIAELQRAGLFRA